MLKLEGVLRPCLTSLLSVVIATTLVACAGTPTPHQDFDDTAPAPKKTTPTTTTPTQTPPKTPPSTTPTKPLPLPPAPDSDAGAKTLPVSPPVPPLLSAVEPATITAGALQPLKVRLLGSGFLQGSTVTVNDKPATAVFANSSTATVTIPIENLKDAGILNLAVVTTTSPPLKSSPVAFTVTAAPPPIMTPPGSPPPTPPPPPTPIALTTLNPNSATAGQTTLLLEVDGTGFTPGSAVRFNGVALPTTVVSASTVTTQVPATQLAKAGLFNVTVVDPKQAPSNTLTFRVNPAAGPVTPKCAVSCATAGVGAPGCIAKGTYAGGYCSSDGCAYEGEAFGCGVYLPNQPPPATTCTVKCSEAGMSSSGCVSSGEYAGAYCDTDTCLYQGSDFGCSVFAGSTSGSDFAKVCTDAGGTDTDDGCKCAGNGIYTNPYYDDCNTTACRENGGSWTGLACACSDGKFINQFFATCSGAPPASTDPGDGMSSDDAFSAECARAGGTYTGSACQCDGDSVFTNPYVDTCNEAACRQNGGEWTGSKCACPDGMFIDQFSERCEAESAGTGPTSNPGDDYPSKCDDAGGTYTGSECQCPGTSIFTNPYANDCNTSACLQNGGKWTGSACACADGTFINQFFATCTPADGSSSGDDFSTKCTGAGGTDTGTACQCAGDSIFTNPYANDCNTAACVQNGGEWSGSACGCTDGTFINQFFAKCPNSSTMTPEPSSSTAPTEFEMTCQEAGGTYTGSACKCSGDNIFTNPYAQDCDTAGCIQNGGSWSSSASTCTCTDGTTIDEFAGKCPGADDAGGDGAF